MGEKCIHCEVCKFFKIEEIPNLVDISSIRYKRKSRNQFSDNDFYKAFTINRKDILRAKHLLRGRRRKGKLTDLQLKIMKDYWNLDYDEMNEGQKEQILNILKNTKK